MVSDERNGPDVSVSETIVVTQHDIEEVERRKTVPASSPEDRPFAAHIMGGLLPGLIASLLVGTLLVVGHVDVVLALLGGGAGGLATLSLITVATHRGWIKAKSAGPVAPAIVIRPDEIPAEVTSRRPGRASATAPRCTSTRGGGTADSEALCPYCSLPLAGMASRTCRQCKTPHHQECWEANRGCTTLGCGGAPR